MKNTYWGNNGKYQVQVGKLQELIPVEGSVPNPYKNKALEKFRNASNCYYDLYNNGLYNRARQFAKVFGLRTMDYRYRSRYGYKYIDLIYERTEEAMDKIVQAAYAEQFPNG